MEELTIFLFDIYPNADRWLDENPGIAISGHREYMGRVFTHVKFSNLMPPEKTAIALEYFPDAENLSKYDDIRGEKLKHRSYSIGLTRKDIVEIFQRRLGAVVKKSPCCIEPISDEECWERMKEIRTRLGKPLSSCSPEEVGNMYRKLFSNS